MDSRRCPVGWAISVVLLAAVAGCGGGAPTGGAQAPDSENATSANNSSGTAPAGTFDSKQAGVCRSLGVEGIVHSYLPEADLVIAYRTDVQIDQFSGQVLCAWAKPGESATESENAPMISASIELTTDTDLEAERTTSQNVGDQVVRNIDLGDDGYLERVGKKGYTASVLIRRTPEQSNIYSFSATRLAGGTGREAVMEMASSATFPPLQ